MKPREDVVAEPMGTKLLTTSWMQNTMGATGGGGGAGEPTMNNIRVKLPDKDDDDLSEVDNDAEVSTEPD